MALNHVLYRCPACGYDPTLGTGDEAWCSACGARFRRIAKAGVEVREGSVVRRARVADLVDAVRAAGGPRRVPDDSGVLLASPALESGEWVDVNVTLTGRLASVRIGEFAKTFQHDSLSRDKTNFSVGFSFGSLSVRDVLATD